MPDYNKSVIYTIKSGDDIYVGSTTNFNVRKGEHKTSIKNGTKRKIYDVIRNNGGEWNMQPYQLYPCNNKLELCIQEEKIRQKLGATMNMYKAYRTPEEKLNYYSEKWKQHKHKYPNSIECKCCGGKIYPRAIDRHLTTKKHLKHFLDDVHKYKIMMQKCRMFWKY